MNALNIHDSKSLDFWNSGFVLVKNDFIQGYKFSVFLPNIYLFIYAILGNILANIYSLLKKMLSILYWCFSFWLTSLCIIGSSFIHLISTTS